MDGEGGLGRRISRATITEQLEEAIRVDILTGILRPGARIRANEMAERYGVSATPFREALQRLAGENLIELDPRLGATVAAMSESDLRDIYEMLGRLDGLALERSIRRRDAAWVARVDQAWAELSRALDRRESLGESPSDAERRTVALQWSSAHWAFHEALYSACDSPWLLRFVRQLHGHADRYQMLTIHGPRPKRDSRAEHGHIMQAATAGDVDGAVSALRGHLALTVRILGEELGARGDVAASAGGDTPTTSD